jgi:catechol 2,3-dioxygenase-like lactoylglutathione lyase family enzyme
MAQSLANVALLVRDYDEALHFFTRVLDFSLVEGSERASGKRWVVVAPPGADETTTRLLLARAATPEQESHIGNQTGGRVFLFLHTDDFARDYERMKARGVRFIEQPRHEPYGDVVVFLDLYRNRWDLLERRHR